MIQALGGVEGILEHTLFKGTYFPTWVLTQRLHGTSTLRWCENGVLAMPLRVDGVFMIT